MVKLYLKDTGLRTIGGAIEFDQVNTGTEFAIQSARISFTNGTQTDDSALTGYIGGGSSTHFGMPEVHQGGVDAPTINMTGGLDLNVVVDQSTMGYLEQLTRTRGLINLYPYDGSGITDSRIFLNYIKYDPLTSLDFSGELVISNTNPLFVRVGKFSFTQSPDSPFRVTYNLTFKIHSE